MTIHNVSTESELATALAAAVGGDEIVLADGVYDGLTHHGCFGRAGWAGRSRRVGG